MLPLASAPAQVYFRSRHGHGFPGFSSTCCVRRQPDPHCVRIPDRAPLWGARDTYLSVSPLFFADEINEPLLVIPGERHANPATVPMRSERFDRYVKKAKPRNGASN